MYLKRHISGDAIVYDSKGQPKQRNIFSTPTTSEARPQGSLYSQQKRKIADACEHLRLSLKNNHDRCPLVFTLTCPDYSKQADAPRFVSKWFDNMRKNYGLGEYVWVREYTKAMVPHFHCVADWFHPSFMFACDVNSRLDFVTTVSLVWSGYFQSDSVSSIWLGGYWYGKRIYYLRSQAQSRYLIKYMGKTFGADKLATHAFVPFGRVLPAPVESKSLKCLQSVSN